MKPALPVTSQRRGPARNAARARSANMPHAISLMQPTVGGKRHTLMEMHPETAKESARTRSDHESLARHYQDAAKDMQAKAAEHKKLLAQYVANKGLYGKQASSLISHCQGLVRIYEQAAAENLSMVESHRQMAAEAK